MLARCFYQRSQQMTGMAHPIGECGAIKCDAFTGKDLRLAIQGQMVGKLRNQHVRQQRWPCNAAFNRTRWRRSLNDDIAPGAGHLHAHMANHLVGRRDAFKDLGDIFAQLVQCAAALGTRIFSG